VVRTVKSQPYSGHESTRDFTQNKVQELRPITSAAIERPGPQQTHFIEQQSVKTYDSILSPAEPLSYLGQYREKAG